MEYLESIERYRENLISLINNCGLNPGTAYYVLKDVLRDLEKTYIQALNQEKLNGTEQMEEGSVGLIESTPEHPDIVPIDIEENQTD